MVMHLDKSSRGKKAAKPIAETKPSTPESKFDVESFNKHKNEERQRQQNRKRNGEIETGKRGRPRKHKVTKNIRVSDDAVTYINAYKNAANLESQDEAIIQVFSAFGKGETMPSDIRRMYEVFLDAKGLK